MRITSNSTLKRASKVGSLISRYQPPRSFETWVSRPELIAQLREGYGKVTVLEGPPGGGKTTLLSTHYAEQASAGECVHWLSLSSSDNDPAVLRRNLLNAFSLESAAADDVMPDMPEGVMGFVDGMELICDPMAHELLEWFVLSVPTNSCVYLSTRRLRGRLLGTARMRGQVTVIGPQALRMDDREAAALLGQPWSEHEVSLLNRYVDGWAAGLRFMQRSPESCQRLLANVERMSPLPPEMCDYFEQEIIASLPESTLSTLMDLSVLERFIPELVSQIPQGACDWGLIDEQIRCGRFIRYLDGQWHWAELHPAFGLYLRQRLRCMKPARFDELKLFVASWFKAHGYTAEAIRHAVHISETAKAARLIEDVGAISVDLSDGPDVAMQYIPVSQAGELPLLFIAQVYHRIRNGKLRQAQALFEEALVQTDGFSRISEKADAETVEGWAFLYQVVFLAIDDRSLLESGNLQRLENEMNRRIGKDQVLAMSMASLVAFGYLDAWRYKEAMAFCNLGLNVDEIRSERKIAIFLLVHKACCLLATDRVEAALAVAQEACRQAALEGTYGLYERMCSQLLLGTVLYESNELETAANTLIPALEQIRDTSGWVYLYAEAYGAAVASIALVESDAAAERLIHDGELFARERNLPRLLNHLAVIRLSELIRAQRWREAMALLESEPIAGQLKLGGLDAYELSTRLPAFLAAARLMLGLERPRDAMDYLGLFKTIDLKALDCRLRFNYHLLSMRAAYLMRRYTPAYEHLLSTLSTGHAAGLLRRVCEARDWLQASYTLACSQGKKVPSHLFEWLVQVLGEFDHPEPAAVAKLIPGNCMLSPRESEIIALIAEGYINKEIAAKLGISEGTVKGHRKKIHEKLGVSSRSQALIRARELLII
ncbi:helix-turn-helix transcriptional regulator [Pseudomonas sp. TTU2014-080ASC]|uniref:helix-turn-helix transcriptional regulator n=1 Tax=Pseudomonas sp. TTU2014-080ASC TaxID=1729724 RepID=UPI0007184B51|nr:LuxR C-terminal-related transcriptional regulator [Pseudomonas sp. TTU2014-080ASC]KRW61053.1 hypothetical protein AO726_06860 [Pseudomonas sp. TTU2014-080ASC]